MSGSLVFSDGLVNGQYGRTLRDSGCTVICVKEKLIKECDLLPEKIRCITITGQVAELRTASVFIDTPYFKGQTNVCVLPNETVADIIIGNVPGAIVCAGENDGEHEVHYGCALTRSMSKPRKPSGVFSDCLVSLHTSPIEFRNAQVADATLQPCFLKAKSNQTGEITFSVENDLLYRTHTSEKKGTTKQLLVPQKL